MRDQAEYCRNLYSTAWRHKLWPDLLLKAFGTIYPVHRVILASQSTYFSTLLRWVSWQPGAVSRGTANPEWSDLPSHDLVLGEDVTQPGFEWILEYFYSSPHLTIARDNAFDVLAAAHYLGVAAVQTACVEFLSQHLDPHNFASCLLWATRTDHGEASDMLAACCRLVLALRLPRNLAVWTPALAHLEPSALLDILSSDYLAVETEYDRYELVKDVARVLSREDGATAAALAGVARGAGVTAGTAALHTSGAGEACDGGAAGGDAWAGRHGVVRRRGGASERPAAGSGAGRLRGIPAGNAELQRMLSSALHISDGGLAKQLRLARSCPSDLQPPQAGPHLASHPAARLPSSSDPSSDAGASPAPYPRGHSPTSAGPAGVQGLDFPQALQGRVGSGALGSRGTSCAAGGGQTAHALSLAVMSPGPVAADVLPSDCSGDEVSTSLSSDASSRSTIRTCVANGLPTEEALLGAEVGTPARAAAAVEISLDVVQVSEGAVRAGIPAVAAACVHMLLCEAVRYEHLTVPQLMAVQGEGLVAPTVLHAALWERTLLDFQLHTRTGPDSSRAASCTSGCPSSSAPSLGASTGRPAPGLGLGSSSSSAVRQPGSLAGALMGEGRPFRICWRLQCRSLLKLRRQDMLQSEPHQYAGGFWRVRLCSSDAACGSLGLYVGRHHAPAAGQAATPAARPPQAQPHGPRQQPRPQPGQPVAPPADQGGPAAAPMAAAPFLGYTDRQASLRGRCRVSVYQADNTALQGRLRLCDTRDFTADFAAGGYFGQARLLAREDLAQLAEDAEVLVFVQLEALVGGAEVEGG